MTGFDDARGPSSKTPPVKGGRAGRGTRRAPAEAERGERTADTTGDPHWHGHRERLKARFRESGAEGLPDYELLELVLFRSIPRRDVKGLAKTLIARFGSFAEVLAAPVDRLNEVDGVGEAVATDLKVVQAAAQRLVKGELRKKPVLSSWSQVIDYCRTVMAFETKEQFRILFLDKRNGLIADEVQQVGTVDHTPVYPREIIKRALELSATAVVLVHNHPTWPFKSRSITHHNSETQHIFGLS